MANHLADGARRIRARAFMLPRADGVALAETFLVSAVVTVLMIRAYLQATGYPQVGGGGLHIAHVLWGGLLMLVGVLLLVLRLGRPALRVGVVLAGVGFGFFIDEIGKFVTSDVNYFFEPAVAMIYVVFVAIAIVLAVVKHRVRMDPRSALANAMALYDQAVNDPAAHDVRREVLRLLEGCDPDEPLVPAMRAAVRAADTAGHVEPSRWQRARIRALSAYDEVARTGWFPWVVLAIFVVLAASTIALAIPIFLEHDGVSFAEWMQVAGTLVMAALVVVGIITWRRSRARAYRWFERGILVDILVTEVFAFYDSPGTATIGVAVDIVLLIAVRIAARHEALGEGAERLPERFPLGL
jgi:hypothetical protein